MPTEGDMTPFVGIIFIRSAGDRRKDTKLVLEKLLYVIVGHHLLIKDVGAGLGALHHADNL